MAGLKTHTKLALVVRREGVGVVRYAHIGTGNYNEKTARTYEDVGMFTADPEIGADLSDLFNYLTGYSASDHLQAAGGVADRDSQPAHRADRRRGVPLRTGTSR